MHIQFRATGNCKTCDVELAGFVTHKCVVLRRGVRVLSDDPGVIAWGPCPRGCLPWDAAPATNVALTCVSEASQVTIAKETAKLERSA